MESMEQIAEPDNGLDPPASVEEMRRKRLAYFDMTQQVIVPSETPPRDENRHSDIQSHSKLQTLEKKDTEREMNSSENHQTFKPKLHPDQEFFKSVGQKDNGNLKGFQSYSGSDVHDENEYHQQRSHMWKPQKSQGFPKETKHTGPVEWSQDFGESQDIDSVSAFNSHVNLRDLGLSTHRPESQSDSGSGGIKGQMYIPSTQGAGRMAQEIFSEKTAEEMRHALGDRGLENLMTKVNQDIGQLQRERPFNRHDDESGIGKAPVFDNKKAEIRRSSRSSSVDSIEHKQTIAREQSPRRRLNPQRSRSPNKMITKNLQHFREGEKEVVTLVRNYDQVTVPKNTRNSFSADEIYRQAYSGQSADLAAAYDRLYYGDMYHGHLPHPMHENHEQSSPLDGRFSSPRRRMSHDSASGMPPNIPPYFNHQFSYPPPPFPTPNLESHYYNGVPMSPHSSRPPNSHLIGQDGGFSYYHQRPLSGPNSQQQPFYQDPNHSFSHPGSSYMPPSPSAIPPSPNSYFYPPYMGPYGVPKFPNGVPLHLPPPPIPPQQMKHGYSAQQPLNPHPPHESARRHSITHLGPCSSQSVDIMANPGTIKAPHPPLVPPALRPKDESHSHGTEHRHIGASQLNQHPQGSETDSYNLQRYFSSLELYNTNSGPPLNSSRSVEGDFYKNDEDAISAFTSVTSTSVGKAGGVTSRLQDLGVDLDHLKHLRVVDRKSAQEEEDKNFEILSKGIRYCPECNASNKAYMDWCSECGEVLIGVELTFPKSKSRQGSAEKKRAGSAKLTRGRDFSRSTEKRAENSRLSYGDASSGEETYARRESPESGRGMSLSSSPVRYRREQEEVGEPKDSGRASSGDVKERRTPSHHDTEEEDVYDIKDSGEDFNDEEVEYIYEDSEPNVLEQIGDPVLREFIISYRNRQISEENSQKASLDNSVHEVPVAESHKLSGKNSLFAKSSLKKTENVSTSEARSSSHHTVPLNEFHANDNDKISLNNSQTLSENPFIGATENETNTVMDDESTIANEPIPKKSKKKKKKKKGVAMDIEIFGYEETRNCRDSSRASNVHEIPVLNLATTSDEESEDDDDDEEETSDEENDEDVPVYKSSPSNDKTSAEKASNISPVKSSVVSQQTQAARCRGGPKRPLTTTNKSPPQPSASFSVATRHNSKGRGNNSVPANYQRHWARSSTAWSSYNPRELSTRSSLNNSPYQGATRGGSHPSSSRVSQSTQSISEAPGSGDGSSAMENSSSSGTSGIPVKQRPFSAGYGNSRKPVSAAERSQRPTSAQVRSSREGPLNQSRGGPPQRPSSAQVRSSQERPHHLVKAASPQRPSSAQVRSSQEGSQYQVRGGTNRPSSAQVRSSRDGPLNQGRGGSPQRPSSAQVRSSREGQLNHTRGMSPQRAPSTRHNNYTGPSRGPHSAEISRVAPLRTGTQEKGMLEDNSVSEARENVTAPEGHTSNDDSPRLICAELHRLPHESVPSDNLHALAKNAYDKFQEMTPRIEEGELSRWQCLPDEIWIYIFDFLNQGDLKQLMCTCQYFYRLANDETLWKYITVKPRYSMTDVSLATIAHHRPLSLAMVKCQGNNVTLDGLHYFFKETQDRLRELNICGCSQGSLVGSFILQVASQYCQRLTHLDASFCNVSDEAFTALCNCAERLESVCMNGFQSMSDISLLTLLKKHGKSLRTLELYACFSLSASVFRSLGEHCTNLRRLCVGSCNKLTDSAMITLSTHLPRIEELDLRGCNNLRNDCIRKIVRNCPRIQTLVLANCQQISDVALTEIATYLKTTLRIIDVCGCNKVTDQGVISLAKNCDRLTTVDISSTKCTSTSVNQLASNSCSRWIETVKLSFLSPLTEMCVVSLIRNCPRLKLIHVFGCSSLRNLSKLRGLNFNLCIEGDSVPGHRP